MRLIRRFMVEFGILSSAFDFLTFAVLLFGFGAAAELFRTGWFLESLLTELLVALAVRTRRPLWKSPPGRPLVISTAAVTAFAILIPFLPGAHLVGFVPLPRVVLLSLAAITIGYVAAAETLKRKLYGNLWLSNPPASRLRGCVGFRRGPGIHGRPLPGDTLGAARDLRRIR